MTEAAIGKRQLYRSIGRRGPFSRLSGVYSDRRWINDLDIVDELDGHTGCVNALSWASTPIYRRGVCSANVILGWSHSGSLLASGSDDKHINIYSYQSDDGDQAFKWATTLHTGHRANIFSVKFMPHSGDSTIVSCAGDHQVRVFDIERSAGASSQDKQRECTKNPVSLYHGNTNCRVYRSHTGRVKRILTETSPFYFLTCSEDGEVRRWDTREPSSSYPSPIESRLNSSGSDSDLFGSRIPPPLISYKRHRLELNTMSCSLSQPYYIALGGSHLHCFLHDGRMAGRDLLSEHGVPYRSSSSADGILQDDKMDTATRCVRRFAPSGVTQESDLKMRNCHITACKISNANPNELIVSWSGDHVYSFDIIRGKNAREAESPLKLSTQVPPLKRKRIPTEIASSLGRQPARLRVLSRAPLSQTRPARRIIVRHSSSGNDDGTESNSSQESSDAEESNEESSQVQDNTNADVHYADWADLEGGDSSDESDSSEDSSTSVGQLLGTRAYRKILEPHAPCLSHINEYVGHCNIETVKDVNYFGLNDEYVVSGSDSGHLFIWDKKTAEVVNILAGDSEVVNVIQGHPYEPILAVSGIDDTIKIFSPDRRAQRAAHLRAPHARTNRRPRTLPLTLTSLSDILLLPGGSLYDDDNETDEVTAPMSDNSETSVQNGEGDRAPSHPVPRRSETRRGDDELTDSEEEDPYSGGGDGLESRKCMHAKDKILRDNELIRSRLNSALYTVSPPRLVSAEVPRTAVSFSEWASWF